MKIMVINGPNLNMLGQREPGIYGSLTLDELNKRIVEKGENQDCDFEFVQSNHEGVLVDAIQKASREMDGIIINAGAYTHTSVALRDAVLCCDKPVVEVHITNPQAREDFRKVSFLAGACQGSIAGFGAASYFLALEWLINYT